MFNRRQSSGVQEVDPSWLAWPTLAEKKQSSPATYGYDGLTSSAIPRIIKKHGQMVMVRYDIIPKGRDAGGIQCWVGSTLVVSFAELPMEAFGAVIRELAAEGLLATARGNFDHSTEHRRLWLRGEPARRPADAPFLPPMEEAAIELADGEAERLDALFNSKAQRKTARRVGTLVSANDRTWLSSALWSVPTTARGCL